MTSTEIKPAKPDVSSDFSLSVRIGILLAIIATMASVLSENQLWRFGLFALAISLLLGALAGVVQAWRRNWQRRKDINLFIPLLEFDSAAKFLVDRSGKVFYRNLMANESGLTEGAMPDVLGHRLAESHELFHTLFAAAEFESHVTQDVVTKRGFTHIKVTRIDPNLYLWSLRDRGHSIRAHADGPKVPLITVGRAGAILFMNSAARALLGERKTNFSDIFVGDEPQFDTVNTLRTENGLVTCFLKQHKASDARKEIFLIPATEGGMLQGGLSFEELPVAVVKISDHGEILLANRAARRLVHLKLQAGSSLSSLVEGLGRPIGDWLQDAREGRLTNTSEFLRVKRDDQEIYVQVTLGPVPGDNEGALYAVINDATELKTLEQQFVQSQKMQAVGQLAGGIAHDFNNLLTAISGHCDLLLMRHDEGDQDFADLTQVALNTNRAASLVGQLLAFSRKQTQQLEVIDLAALLSDLGHLLNRLVGEKFNLHIKQDPDLRPIRVDPQQFEQVLMNLVVNARDAMLDGGDIWLETANFSLSEAKQMDKVTMPPGEYVEISVKDTGVGIDQSRLDKVFEPFYTTKDIGEGTGLGLSMTYGIVKQSGGYIFLKSELDVGSEFTIYFPAAEPEDKETSQPIDLRLGGHLPVNGVILLVEDEAPVRSFAARALKLNGHTVIEAESGEAALNILRDRSLQINLIISDVIMPDMDGPKWVNLARQTRPDVPVVFISGYAEESLGDDRRRLENTTFLPKPFSLHELNDAVQQQLTRAQKAG